MGEAAGQMGRALRFYSGPLCYLIEISKGCPGGCVDRKFKVERSSELMDLHCDSHHLNVKYGLRVIMTF